MKIYNEIKVEGSDALIFLTSKYRYVQKSVEKTNRKQKKNTMFQSIVPYLSEEEQLLLKCYLITVDKKNYTKEERKMMQVLLKTGKENNKKLKNIFQKLKMYSILLETKEISHKTKEKLTSKENAKPFIYDKASRILQTSSMEAIFSDFSFQEAVIVLLKLGYIDGMYYNTQEIAKLLSIEESQVNETIQKFVQFYKNNEKKNTKILSLNKIKN